jgi:hypothetical protein
VCDAAARAAADFDHDLNYDVFELDFDWAAAGQLGSGDGSEAVGESACGAGARRTGR